MSDTPRYPFGTVCIYYLCVYQLGRNHAVQNLNLVFACHFCVNGEDLQFEQ